ncbi:MAG: hypothetical protein JWO96_392 [Candidatus Saccharibacteria bacterium]|nr:hypothetical protein [Candidatus Saccharibacteria bacterium]
MTRTLCHIVMAEHRNGWLSYRTDQQVVEESWPHNFVYAGPLLKLGEYQQKSLTSFGAQLLEKLREMSAIDFICYTQHEIRVYSPVILLSPYLKERVLETISSSYGADGYEVQLISLSDIRQGVNFTDRLPDLPAPIECVTAG